MATRYYGTQTTYAVAHVIADTELALSASAPSTGSASVSVRKSATVSPFAWTGPSTGTTFTTYASSASQSLDLSAFPAGLSLVTGSIAEDAQTVIVSDGGVTDLDAVQMGAWSSTTGTGIKTRSYSSGAFDYGSFAASDEVSWAISVQNSDSKNALTVTVDFSSNDTWVEITQGAVSLTSTGALTTPPSVVVGTGSQQNAASGTVTLPSLAIAGTGNVPQPATSTGALSLASLTVAGTGAQANASSGSLTLPALAVSGSAAQTNASSGSLSLPSAAVSGTGALAYSASGALLLTSLAVAGTATATEATTPKTTTARVTLGALADPAVHYDHVVVVRARVQSGSGTLYLSLYEGETERAALSQVLDDTLTDYELALSEAQAESITDYSALELAFYGESESATTFEIDTLAFAVPDSGGHVATGHVDLAAVTVAGTAEHVAAAAATGAITLQPVVVSGAAESVQNVSASGAIVLPSAAVAGTASQALSSSGALTLQPATVAGSGFHSEGLVATGSVGLQPVTVAATGTQTDSATGAVTLPAATVAGTGSEAHTSTGAATLKAPTVSGAATQAHVATGAITLAAPTMDGTGVVTFSGSGDLTLGGLAIDGVGSVLQNVSATGALTLGGVSIEGTGDNGEQAAPSGGGYYRRPLPRKPKPMPIVGTGALVLAPLAVSGEAQHEFDDLWLYLEPALYLAGVT